MSALALTIAVCGTTPESRAQEGEYCPNTCQAQPTTYDSGAPPLVVVILPFNTQSGTGTLHCATCVKCRTGVSVAFTGYGTYCGSYSINGSNPPVVPQDPTNWARNGFAYSTCDDEFPDHIDVTITNCATGALVATAGFYLYCPCQF
ncbi:MAG: hypothetical protein HZA52_02925 [Planctomycetes bacterium]|nr:hypothetical protein [Planctomycetota bacterium]